MDYFESGFCVNEASWHRKELLLPSDQRPTRWVDARPLAGLDWDPQIVPLYGYAGIHADGTTAYQPGDDVVGDYFASEDYRRIIRSDTGAELATVTDSYTLIDHGEMGEIIEAILEQPNVSWETAGSVEGGRAVWCLALLDEPLELPGDDSLTLPYMAMTNRHDGNGGCTLRSTAVRIVCANTFRASELEGQRTGATYTFVHSKGWRDRITEAREAVRGARDEFAAYAKLATDLLGVTVTPRQREIFIRTFIPAPPDGLASDRVIANVEKSRQVLREIFESKTTAGVAHTAYGLVQGAGEYLDHARTARSWETRLNRQLLRPEPLKAKARTLALEVASA